MQPADRSDALRAPFEVLEEAADLPTYDLPPGLGNLYSGRIGFEPSCLYANFVSSVDGVVALGAGHPSPGGTISGNSIADRFVMGLLRACADSVLIGAGTLRDSPGHRWTPQHVYPDAATAFASLRESLGRAPDPRLVVVSASGNIDADHPGLQPGTLILTSDSGAERLRGRLGVDVELRSLGAGADMSVRRIVDVLHGDGDRVILTEGGPTLVGRLLREHLVDELFLTLAPVLFGRSSSDERSGLVAGIAFEAGEAPNLAMRSVRRHGSHMFLRYGVVPAG